VETEQLVEVGGNVASQVQSRGSIPLLWSQIPERWRLFFNPPPMLDAHDVADHRILLETHFETQVELYGYQAILNLIQHEGPESDIELMFRNTLAVVGNNSLRNIPIDFMHECALRKWEQLETLVTEDPTVIELLAEYGFHLQDSEGGRRETARQTGVFRTNCIDCLDRTNVGQSWLAMMNLLAVFGRLGVEGNQAFLEEVKEIWVKNGNQLSLQHSGSGATYTQITKSDKYSFPGKMKDWSRSAKRWYVNNFQDGYNQDALEVFLGKFPVVKGAQDIPPVGRKVERKIQVMASAALLLAVALCYFLISPEMPWYCILAIILSVLVGFGCMMAMGVLIIGRDLPRLR